MRLKRGVLCLVLTALATFSAGADTLDSVRERGAVRCGVSQGLPGFSNPSKERGWSGLDVDFCRAVAAATLGDSSRVKFVPLSAKERFTALQSGEIDLLSRNTTWTATRDTTLGLHFAGVLFYDGQGFMVRRSLGVDSVRQLDGATICTNAGTTTELNLADYFRKHDMEFRPVVFEKYDEVIAAYEARRCDAYTTDRSGLFAQRIRLQDPDAHVILPEVISKEPLGPVVRQGDDRWFNIVKWTLFALIAADELEVTSDNVVAVKRGDDPKIRRLLGVDGTIGTTLGLEPGWAADVIAQVGNYAQLFVRNVGAGSRLKMDRGLNRLWTDGGLLYAPPFR